MTIFIEYENEILAYKSFEDWLDYHGIEDKIPHDVVCMWDKPVVMPDAASITRKCVARAILQVWLDKIVESAKEGREHIRMERNRGSYE